MVLFIVFTTILVSLVYYITKTLFNQEFDALDEDAVSIDAQMGLRDRRDCDQDVVYCFEDAHCTKICAAKFGSRCSNGVCINAAIINSQAPNNECDARRGVLTYFVGNPMLGRYDYLCKSVDPGIASNDISEPNRMCLGGQIAIDYLQQFPAENQCQCLPGYSKVSIPNTSSIRNYVVCVEDAKSKIIV